MVAVAAGWSFGSAVALDLRVVEGRTVEVARAAAAVVARSSASAPAGQAASSRFHDLAAAVG